MPKKSKNFLLAQLQFKRKTYKEWRHRRQQRKDAGNQKYERLVWENDLRDVRDKQQAGFYRKLLKYGLIVLILICASFFTTWSVSKVIFWIVTFGVIIFFFYIGYKLYVTFMEAEKKAAAVIHAENEEKKREEQARVRSQPLYGAIRQTPAHHSTAQQQTAPSGSAAQQPGSTSNPAPQQPATAGAQPAPTQPQSTAPSSPASPAQVSTRPSAARIIQTPSRRR